MDNQNSIYNSNNSYNNKDNINDNSNNDNNNNNNNNDHNSSTNDNNKRMNLDEVKQDHGISMNGLCITKELLNTTQTDCINVQNLIVNLINPNNYASINWELLKDYKNLTSLTINSDYLFKQECIYDISYWLRQGNIHLKELYIQVIVTNPVESYNIINNNNYLLSLISLLFPQLYKLKIHYYKRISFYPRMHRNTSLRLLQLINPNPQLYNLQLNKAMSENLSVIIRYAFKLYSTNNLTMNKEQFINYYCFVNDYKTIYECNDMYVYNFILLSFHPGYIINNNITNNELQQLLNEKSDVTIPVERLGVFYFYYVICNNWPNYTESTEILYTGPYNKQIIPNRLKLLLKQFYKLGYNRLLQPIKPEFTVDTTNNHNNDSNNTSNTSFYDLYYKYYGENKDYFELSETSPVSFSGLFNLESLDIKFLFVLEEHQHRITQFYKSIQGLPKLKCLTIDVNYFIKNGGNLEQFNILISNPNINELNFAYECDIIDSSQIDIKSIHMVYKLYNTIYRTNNWYNISGNLISLNYDSILQKGLFVLLNGCGNLQELCVNVSRFKLCSIDDYSSAFTGPVTIIYSKYDYSIFHCYNNFFGPYNFILLLYNLLSTKLNKLILKNWHLCIKSNEIKLSNRLYNLLKRVETDSMYNDNNDFIQFEFSSNTIPLHTFIAIAEGLQFANADSNNSNSGITNPGNIGNNITMIFHIQDLMQLICHCLNSRELVNMCKTTSNLYKFISSNKLCWTYCPQYFLSSNSEEVSWLSNNSRPKIIRNNIQYISIETSNNGSEPLLTLFQTIIIPQYNQIIKIQIYGKHLDYIYDPQSTETGYKYNRQFWRLFGNNFPLLQIFEMITINHYDVQFYLPYFKLAFKRTYRSKLIYFSFKCVNIGDEHISILSDNCPNLTSLNLSTAGTRYEDTVSKMFKSPELLKISLAKFINLTKLSFSFERWSVGLNFYPIICSTLGNQLIDLSLTFTFGCVYGRNQQELNYFTLLRVIKKLTIKFWELYHWTIENNTPNETANITNDQLIWYFPKFSSSLQYINLYFDRYSANIHEFEYTNLNYILKNCIDYGTIKTINYLFDSKRIPLLNQKQIYSIISNIILSNNQLLTISLLQHCDNNIKDILESAVKFYQIKVMDKNPKSIAINYRQLNYLLTYCQQNNVSS